MARPSEMLTNMAFRTRLLRSTCLPFLGFGVPPLNPNSRKRGTLIINGLLRILRDLENMTVMIADCNKFKNKRVYV